MYLAFLMNVTEIGVFMIYLSPIFKYKEERKENNVFGNSLEIIVPHEFHLYGTVNIMRSLINLPVVDIFLSIFIFFCLFVS